jgi:hypothetical protein
MSNEQFSAPLGSLRNGRLEFTRGAARLTIRSASIPAHVEVVTE